MHGPLFSCFWGQRLASKELRVQIHNNIVIKVLIKLSIFNTCTSVLYVTAGNPHISMTYTILITFSSNALLKVVTWLLKCLALIIF